MIPQKAKTPAAPASTTRKFATSVIEIWQNGGPCQLETFDPKPRAPYDYNNGLKSIKTNAGFEVHEWLPELAKCADLYSVVRTLTHPFPGHEKAAYIMQTGHMPGDGITYPSIGAAISSTMLMQKKYEGDLPPFVILTQPKGRFSELGFLSDAYAPLVTGGDPKAKKFIVDGIVPPGGLTDEQLKARFARCARVSRVAVDPVFEKAGLDAQKIITGTAAKTFNLNEEDKKMRERYGRTTIGQQLLAARRLVEYGVPYICVNYGGWDSHKKHFETMKRPTHEMDQAVAALLTDLKGKNLLDSTIVWLAGEFGRVPKVDRQAPWNGGRNHFPRCFSALIAGGGLKGGGAVGVSDDTTDKVKERPVTPPDFLGTICERMGVDPDDRLPSAKKDFRQSVMPKGSDCGRLKELYA